MVIDDPVVYKVIKNEVKAARINGILFQRFIAIPLALIKLLIFNVVIRVKNDFRVQVEKIYIVKIFLTFFSIAVIVNESDSCR
jgi:hypothetical protein